MTDASIHNEIAEMQKMVNGGDLNSATKQLLSFVAKSPEMIPRRREVVNIRASYVDLAEDASVSGKSGETDVRTKDLRNRILKLLGEIAQSVPSQSALHVDEFVESTQENQLSINGSSSTLAGDDISSNSPIPIAQPKRALRVFLCHSSDDKPAIRDFYRRLVDDGINVWFDEENLLPGQDWNQEIIQAVRATDVVIVCISRNIINKAGYVQKEIRLALDVADEQPEGAIFLIPLKLEECEVPERLNRWQWVDHFNDDQGYKRLMNALRFRARALGITAL